MNRNRNGALKVGLLELLDTGAAIDFIAYGYRADGRERRALHAARQRRIEPDQLLIALADAAVRGWTAKVG